MQPRSRPGSRQRTRGVRSGRAFRRYDPRVHGQSLRSVCCVSSNATSACSRHSRSRVRSTPGATCARVSALLRTLEREGRIARARGGWRRARAGGLAPASCRRESDGTLVAVDEEGRRHPIEEGAALEGERVLLDVAGPHAEVARAVGGARRDWVGILSRRGREGVVTPYRDDAKWELRIPRGANRGARPGDVVVAVADAARPARGRHGGRARAAPSARVVEVLGAPGTPEADFRAIAWRHRLRRDFPADVLAAAAACSDALDPAEVARRRDLRALPFVTIDPATARDHDDAVCVEPAPRGRTRLVGRDRGRLALRARGRRARPRGTLARQQRVLPGSRHPDVARAPLGRAVLAASRRSIAWCSRSSSRSTRAATCAHRASTRP